MNQEHKVVKANYLVNLKTPYSYSEVEKKIICSIVAKVLPTDEDFKNYEIPLSELGLNFTDSKNHSKYIKKSKEWDKLTVEKHRTEKNIFDLIMSKPINLPNNDGLVNWFSWIRLNEEEKIIECRFDKALKPYLLQLKENFTSYHLKNVLTLRSSYAIDVYELCKQFMPDPTSEAIKENKVVNFAFRTINLQEFRDLLHIPESYKNNDVSRLLEKVVEDINEKTNLFITFKMQKKGRKFSSIRFDIERKSYRENKLNDSPDEVVLEEMSNNNYFEAPEDSILNPKNFNKN
ncbi:hypothetical protein CRV00_12015 [Malaciobacter molluscorum]|uniref:replication initiation protein n=1 Tax=Malaciobacter molluscorum TaxID=1032072 RepID=UPI00100B5CC8|nr:replication initiation protein [Malaciobacter molluscorum]RXJ92866.1 hypothetical protein CRV00_12015 [Malaciobacter molluscorum]